MILRRLLSYAADRADIVSPSLLLLRQRPSVRWVLSGDLRHCRAEDRPKWLEIQSALEDVARGCVEP